VIAEILPAAAASAESAGTEPGDPGPGPWLFPAEEAVVRTAGPGRRAEFTAGRRCAREALARLGLPAAPVPAGRAGEPRWPAGVVGSITHCAGYRACAVALATDVAAIGIDAEPDDGLPAGLIESLATEAERAWIARQAAAAPVVHWDRLQFSAKEAAAKLWYPLTGRWPGFRQVAVFPTAAGTFRVQVTGPDPAPDGGLPARMTGATGRPGITGRWLARGGLIVTAVTWPARSAERE
jgi:enterobactin synthetase component D / holo-[acyl-carrier protein] synthase